MKKEEAMKLAVEKDLDLVEVSPNAKPPVAKILEWSKFKYDMEKKKKESKGKNTEMKEMWFQAYIGKGDLEHKLKRIEEFLDKKHQVKLTVRPARRKRYDREALIKLMNRIMGSLGKSVKFEGNAKFEGRNYAIIVTPVKKQNEKNT